ncbi:hypothetical protein NDU88_003174 [Pleurodeles waltl]|uniref:Uncharacterized protein n=1 Tax=Pleurodeles waltl TaxID=8319 RepID=A0AAV7RHU2_PLEWA|nr:hypothetical protein NDU88_003174 [Pleurodeles waltl]
MSIHYCDGLDGAGPHNSPACAVTASGDPESKESPTNQVGAASEERGRGANKDDGDGRTGETRETFIPIKDRRTGETRETFVPIGDGRTGDQGAVRPNRGREDVNRGRGMQQPATNLEKRGDHRYPGRGRRLQAPVHRSVPDLQTIEEHHIIKQVPSP